MFRCGMCGVNVGPGISANTFVTRTRPQTYTNKVDGETKISHGTEIVAEIKVCPACKPGV